MFEVFNVFIRDCFVPYELGLSVFVWTTQLFVFPFDVACWLFGRLLLLADPVLSM